MQKSLNCLVAVLIQHTVGDVIRESGKWLAINEDDHAAQLRKNRQPKWPALEQAMTA